MPVSSFICDCDNRVVTTFLLIRHGVTDITGKILTGRLPGYHLNAEGRAQADAVRDRHAASNISAIYCSPLERAIETATPLANHLKLPIQNCEAFNEVDYGQWSGMDFSQIQALEDWSRFNQHRGSARPPEGESILDLQHRTLPELRNLCDLHAGSTIAVFSHGDPIRATLLACLGMSGDFVHRLQVAPGSTSVIEMQDGEWRVMRINCEC